METVNMETRKIDGVGSFNLTLISRRMAGWHTLVIVLLLMVWTNPAAAVLLFSNSHSYGFGADPAAVVIDVEVHDNYLGDLGKYLWQYKVTNNSYDPNPGTSNGFSGFETALPGGVPDLADLFAPNAGWVFDCCSGQPVEWDIRDSVGLGVMPGGMGTFGFTSLPRHITESTGWFHTWQNGGQTDLVYYEPGNGVEVPDVLRPPIVPEPSILSLLASGSALLGLLGLRKRG